METSKDWTPEPKCAYANIRICFCDEAGTWHINQACCNHWDCPRCGPIRAKEEYARIVEGAKALGEKPLYFWTMTCRGKEMTKAEAEAGYLTWTNRLLTSARAKAKRADARFEYIYVQVTERQRRGHPHSHMICTYAPPDVIEFRRGQQLPNGRTARLDTGISHESVFSGPTPVDATAFASGGQDGKARKSSRS